MTASSLLYMPVVDADDPLLPMLALQHDFRERFFHALTEIMDALGEELSPEDRLAKVTVIAAEALDHESIQKWLAANRPLPWLDEILGAQADDLTRRVLDQMGIDNSI